ncbi:MAG TPA: hypothetical protein VJ894_08095 [Cryomorphaceae bacterium]|nr:hypothetical protein [Cryomorphaceae bacterium]
MKKYILLFTLAFAIAGVSNAQTTNSKGEITKVETVKKAEVSQKAAASDKKVISKVAKAPTCKEMSKSCCKDKKGNAQASTENGAEKKACCSKMADAKEGKACCDKMTDKMKADKEKTAKKS